MTALFVGHSYIDMTMITDDMPTGDEKSVATDYAVSFGGNAVTAAFACAKLGIQTDLLTTMSDDWLGQMFWEMAHKYGVSIYPRKVERSSLSFVLPKGGKRAILRARDNKYLRPFMKLDVSSYQALHLDGHQADAALFYAKAFRQRGLLTSLDGGAVRSNTEEVLHNTDVAVVAEAFCEQLKLTALDTLAYLAARGVKIAAVTEGEHGLLWSDENGLISRMPALPVPSEKVIDTSGAGDVFHGAYLASYLRNRTGRWADHFDFARAASAFKVQHLGNEAGLPAESDIAEMQRLYGESAVAI
ncbi:PfkB family carbohydrate kinase [Rhodoblastus acidophilus]|uniref:PfkB family carbohydrate kinase n=1 Tax=Candidatus Rhodoblastus alkanivorans TaxID=2954117 RepID=A0ABS9Z5M6_9HYPH|nr:PfkB family carbohydrate kinase [Candidatus Rhodoblastus alkanivorans]MCI4682975.1 PfkB family carbohydrate kinase [Candidatus Rhodoblastus alkanivorans]MDI4640285.1 PfkB family carbohydrate kinase [Rhodoblastus acidophilus]